MVVIEIKLLFNQFGGTPWLSAVNEGKCEIIPSPLRIIRSVLSGCYQDSYVKSGEFDNLTQEQIVLISKFASVDPSYYIPTYSHTGNISYLPDYLTGFRDIVVEGKETGASRRMNFSAHIDVGDSDNSYYVFYDINLSASERQLLTSALEYLAYLGRSEFAAKWKLLRNNKVIPNCAISTSGEVVDAVNMECDDLIHHLSMSPQQSKEDGYRMSPALRVAYYKLNAIRQTVQKSVTKEFGQEILLSISPDEKIPASKQLSVTNVIHKLLCKRCPSNPQIIGKYNDGSFLEQDKALFFETYLTSNDGFVCAVSIKCMTQIDDEIISALKLLYFISLDGCKHNIRMMGVSRLPKRESYRYRSVTPVLLPTEVRKAIHRQPQAIVINHAIMQLGLGKKSKDFQRLDDGSLVTHIEGFGHIRCNTVFISSNNQPFRGNRMAASPDGYSVVLEFDTPVELFAIGSHFRFGNGKLEPF